MTPEKWQESWSKSFIAERPFLLLCRVLYVYPWRSYGVVFAISALLFVGNFEELGEADEPLVGSAIIVLGLFPYFYSFGVRYLLWVVLRLIGHPAEYLRY